MQQAYAAKGNSIESVLTDLPIHSVSLVCQIVQAKVGIQNCPFNIIGKNVPGS